MSSATPIFSLDQVSRADPSESDVMEVPDPMEESEDFMLQLLVTQLDFLGGVRRFEKSHPQLRWPIQWPN